MTRASEELITEARAALAKARDEISAARSKRDALVVHYLDRGVPVAQCAAGLDTTDRTRIYDLSRQGGRTGPARNTAVDLAGHKVHPSVRLLYDILVDLAGPEGGFVTITQAALAERVGFGEPHTWRLLRRLVDLGVIRHEQAPREGGRYGPSTFHIV